MSNKPKIKNGKEVTVRAEKREFFSGPLPPPDVVRQYNEISPGAADKIFEAFEKQNNHRIEIEKKIVNDSVFRAKTGQFMAFIICIFVLCLSTYLFMNNKSTSAFVLIISNVTILISTFYSVNKKKDKDLEDKNEKLNKY